MSGSKTILINTRQVGTVTAFLPIVKELEKRQIEFSISSSDQSSIEWNRIGYNQQIDFENIVFQDYSLILTGTSILSEEDIRFWKMGEKLNITTAAFVDSWANYAERFTNKTPYDTVPQVVLVVDELMKKRLIESGAPKERIRIVGHPRFESLKNEFQKNTTKKSNTKTIVLFTDPVIINGKNTLELAGYDPIELTKEIIEEFLKEKFSHLEFKLIIKPHPRENVQEYKRLIENYRSDKIELSRELNSINLLKKADVVFGYTSILLLDASTLGIPTYSFQPERKLNTNDITDNRRGINVILSYDEINLIIKNILVQNRTLNYLPTNTISNKLLDFVLKNY